MAGGVTYRDPRTNNETTAENAKTAKILEQGGYQKVTSATPKVQQPDPEPSTVAEHVAAAKKAGKTAEPVESITRADTVQKSGA